MASTSVGSGRWWRRQEPRAAGQGRQSQHSERHLRPQCFDAMHRSGSKVRAEGGHGAGDSRDSVILSLDRRIKRNSVSRSLVELSNQSPERAQLLVTGGASRTLTPALSFAGEWIIRKMPKGQYRGVLPLTCCLSPLLGALRAAAAGRTAEGCLSHARSTVGIVR